MPKKFILAIDQGTTSSRGIVFDCHINPVGTAQKEFEQIFPQSGWVEHNPEEIWETVQETAKRAILEAGITAGEVSAIGITNQRETLVVWDKSSGAAVYNAIVWQDRRTGEYCKSLKDAGHEAMVTQKTGLLLDPYFTSTKLNWVLENVEGARARAEAGELLAGTIDSYLIWRMTKGARHVTDATNAARTMLYNIREGAWDADLLDLFQIPASMLPEVLDSAADFGMASADFLGAEVPITGVAGDQQAATVGQACFEPGMLKSTYGTGCFALLNTGDTLIESQNRLLGTIAYQLDGQPTYALEGSIFIAGAVVQWLRDGLEIIKDAAETGDMAASADDTQDTIIVPAFTGLGAPYWDAEVRGAVFGVTRNTGPKEMARAALQSVGYQTRDLLEAMQADMGGAGEAVLRVDGGMTASDYAMQFLADIIDAPVDRPTVLETTAKGAAWLAGQHVGLYPDMEEFAKGWALERKFEPEMDASTRDAKYDRWKKSVAAAQMVI